MTFRRLAPRETHPYHHAPRLPEGALALADVWNAAGPFEIEIGPGRGVFIAERAEAAPDVYILGIEVRLKWATLVNERLGRAGLSARARVVAEDARDALARLGPDASVRAIFVHFPDPWWKKKHEKRLVLGSTLPGDAARLLVDGGDLFVQTDVEDRAMQYREILDAAVGLQPAGDAPGEPWLSENPYGARSPREKRAIEDGLPVWRLRYRREARAR